MASLMLPWIIMCAVLMALSFARDYESGLMQSLLSVPVISQIVFYGKVCCCNFTLGFAFLGVYYVFCRSYFLFKSLACFTAFLFCSTCFPFISDVLRRCKRFNCFNDKAHYSISVDSIACKLFLLVPNKYIHFLFTYEWGKLC